MDLVVPAIHLAYMTMTITQQFALAKASAVGMSGWGSVNLFVPVIPSKIPAPPSTVVGKETSVDLVVSVLLKVSSPLCHQSQHYALAKAPATAVGMN